MKSFIVGRSVMLKEGRDDARFFLPRVFDPHSVSNVRWCPLSKLAKVRKELITPSRMPSKIYRLINVAEVDEKEGRIRQIHDMAGSEIKGTKFAAKSGEIVFARIEPSIYNKKSAIVPDNVKELICSTELIPISPKKGVNSKFLLWVLRSDWFASQITESLMRGSTGRRRLNHDDFEKLMVPDVSSEDQRAISELIVSAEKERENKLKQADEVMTTLSRTIKERIPMTQPYEE